MAQRIMKIEVCDNATCRNERPVKPNGKAEGIYLTVNVQPKSTAVKARSFKRYVCSADCVEPVWQGMQFKVDEALE